MNVTIIRTNNILNEYHNHKKELYPLVKGRTKLYTISVSTVGLTFRPSNEGLLCPSAHGNSQRRIS